MDNAGMTALTIRDMPEETVRELKTRAARDGKSLQAYVRSILTREAAKPTLAEAVERARWTADADLSVKDVLDVIDEARGRR